MMDFMSATSFARLILQQWEDFEKAYDSLFAKQPLSNLMEPLSKDWTTIKDSFMGLMRQEGLCDDMTNATKISSLILMRSRAQQKLQILRKHF